MSEATLAAQWVLMPMLVGLVSAFQGVVIGALYFYFVLNAAQGLGRIFADRKLPDALRWLALLLVTAGCLWLLGALILWGYREVIDLIGTGTRWTPRC